MRKPIALGLVLLAIAGLLAPVGAVAAASNHSAPNNTSAVDDAEDRFTEVQSRLGPTRQADLALRQPEYVAQPVERSRDNQTRVYKVRGGRIQIVPQNFATDDVEDFGISSAGGELTYDSTFDQYRLDPDGTGTYELYWIVNERVTDGNSTSTKSVRYEARVRVAGQTDLVHRSRQEVERNSEAAQNWREFNATIHSSDLAGPSANTERVVQEMIDWYRLRKDPVAALTGNLTTIVLLMVTTLGGLLLVALIGIYFQSALLRAYRKLNIYLSVESEEGEAAEKISELDWRDRQRRLQDMDWNDIFADDHVSYAFRETFGENVLDGTVAYLNTMSPRALLKDRLRAMGHDGYVAQVERSATDGGTDAAPSIEAAEIVREQHVDEDQNEDDVVHLDECEDNTLEAIVDALDSWDEATVRRFDLVEADYAPDPDRDVEPVSMPLDDLVADLDADMMHFEDKAVFAEYLLEFITAVREHPVTDDQGRVDSLRYAVNHWLQHAELLDDRFAFPGVEYHRQALERALLDYDPEAEVDQLVSDARSRRL